MEAIDGYAVPSKARILLVDDRPENLLALEALLEPLGHALVRAGSGQEALDALRGDEFALILLDIRMPGLDGLETAARFRSLSAGRTPIIFVTADGIAHYARRAYELGAADILVKPIDPQTLLAKVGVFIELFQRGQRIRQEDSERIAREEKLRALEARPASSSAEELERLRLENVWLREALRARDALIAIAPAFCGFLSADGFITDVNDLALHVIEATREEIIGKLFWEAPWWAPLPQSVARVREAVAEAAAGGGGSQCDIEYCALQGGVGQTRWVVLGITPFRDEQGKVFRIAATGTDITERRQAEESLRLSNVERTRLLTDEQGARRDAEAAQHKAESASRTKDEFLAVASHELRTPLNAILGWARILRGQSLDAAGFLRGLETIERNAKAQVQLIEDILDSSRIITGKLHLEVRSLDLTVIVEAVLDAVRPSAAAKEIAVTVRLDPAAAHIRGDTDRLQQVVWNLVNNAIKFTPRGGRVEVGLERIGSNVELSIKDDGQGIVPEFLPHIFERFRQGDASTTRRHGGLGLGLALVRYLVEAHGGAVRVESDGPGRGATFAVTLPVLAVFPEMAASSRPPVAGEGARGATKALSLGGISVLVVDDEPDARDLVATVLRLHGAAVTLADSAEQALELLARSAPAILVSDIGMPVTDGYALIRRVRALDTDAANIPALALTAYAREEDRRRALEAGFHAHLAKPVDPEVLVRMVLERARAS
jgi:PAS domain S-box-containing protein